MIHPSVPNTHLFLTSKVRLHCDCFRSVECRSTLELFLTSKVRLHCDPAEYVDYMHSLGFS